jgi:hypothetical protein
MAWRPEGSDCPDTPDHVKRINHEKFDVRHTGGDGFGQ